jgi:hypothetical protein
VIVLDSVDVEMALTVPGVASEPERRTITKAAHLSGNRVCVSATSVKGEDPKQAVLSELARFIYRAASDASERIEAPTCGGPLGGSAQQLAECLEDFSLVGPDTRDAWCRRRELKAELKDEVWERLAATADGVDVANENTLMDPRDIDNGDPKYLVTPRRKFTGRTNDANKLRGFDPAASEHVLVQPGLAPELGEYQTPDKPSVLLTEPVVQDTPAPRGQPTSGEDTRTSEDDGASGPTAARTASGRSVVGGEGTASESIVSGDAPNIQSTDDSGDGGELRSTPGVVGMPQSAGARGDAIGSRGTHDNGVAGGWIAGMLSPEFDSPLMIDIDSIPETALPPLDHAGVSSIASATGATAVGRAGEACVFQHLERLASDNSLASELLADDSGEEKHEGTWAVEWLNAESESGAPYDLVCTLRGSDGVVEQVFVEVKSTSGVDKARFEISAQEIEFMQHAPHRCVIARVYDVVPPYSSVRLRLVQQPWEMARQKAVRLEMII